jgi:hypothetical protein
LKALGAIYLAAFVSLWTQVQGLYGSNGIFPVATYLHAIAEKFGIVFVQLPSVFWISASDAALHLVCGAGVVFSLLIIAGVIPTFSLAAAWLLYLSFLSAGGPFLSFQWDILLLETGFLAIFLAWRKSPSRIVVFLLHFLLFKLMLSSGLVKLASHDPSWRALTALTFHYETQPLPTWIGYFIHHLPAWFHKLCEIWLFVIELAFPLLIFCPRRLRYAGCAGFVALQIFILLTGNYTFFNYLAIALCVMLLDDSFWKPRFRRESVAGPEPAIMFPLLALILFLNAVLWPIRFGAESFIPDPVVKLAMNLNRLELVNNYGLFAVMTTNRSEIIVEGSDDGRTWRAYEFKYKPGDLSRRPAFVSPHQPRLDWQMWFAALGTPRDNPWFLNFCVRLLQGSKPVLNLLEKNPFPDHAPRYVRAMMYDYHFTTLSEKKRTGQWWTRSNERIYLDPISLQ